MAPDQRKAESSEDEDSSESGSSSAESEELPRKAHTAALQVPAKTVKVISDIAPPQPAQPALEATSQPQAAASAAALRSVLEMTAASTTSTQAPRGELVSPMIFEAEPANDLVVVGNATGCGAWLGKAMDSSQFIAVVRTPAAPSPMVILEAPLAEQVGLPFEARKRTWVAFRVKRKVGDPRVPLTTLNALCEQLTKAGVEPRTLVPIDSRSYLLFSRDQVQAAAAALVQAGHLVGPTLRLNPTPEVPASDPERLRLYAGAWCLTRREKGSGPADEFSATAIANGSPLRIQASCGLYADFRVPAQGAPGGESEHASCFGRIGLQGQQMTRHPAVSFQPSTGGALPSLGLRLDREGAVVTLQEEAGASGSCDHLVERWCRLGGDNLQQVTALELKVDSSNRRGVWLFSGKHFVRIIGPEYGSGLLGSSCCKSLSQLESFKGADTVRAELCRNYEAVLGEVERPGLLRATRDAWDASRAGTVFWEADAKDVAENKFGILKITKVEGLVECQLRSGETQRWQIKEWGFDPFTPPESESESEESSESGEKSADEEAVAKAKAKAEAANAAAKKQAAAAAAGSDSDSDSDSDEESAEGPVKGALPEVKVRLGKAADAASDSGSESAQPATKKDKAEKKAKPTAALSDSSDSPVVKKKKDKKKKKEGKQDKKRAASRSKSKKGKAKKEKKKLELSESSSVEVKKKKKKDKDKKEKKKFGLSGSSSVEVKKKKKKDKEKDKEKSKDKAGAKDKDKRQRSKSRKKCVATSPETSPERRHGVARRFGKGSRSRSVRSQRRGVRRDDGPRRRSPSFRRRDARGRDGRFGGRGSPDYRRPRRSPSRSLRRPNRGRSSPRRSPLKKSQKRSLQRKSQKRDRSGSPPTKKDNRSPSPSQLSAEVRQSAVNRAAEAAKLLEKDLADKAEAEKNFLGQPKAPGSPSMMHLPFTVPPPMAASMFSVPEQKGPFGRPSFSFSMKKAEQKESGNGMLMQDVSMAGRVQATAPLTGSEEQLEHVKQFVKLSGLDERALEALRGLRPELQNKLMAEGPIPPGGSGPLHALMDRIRRVVDDASTQGMTSGAAPEVAMCGAAVPASAGVAMWSMDPAAGLAPLPPPVATGMSMVDVSASMDAARPKPGFAEPPPGVQAPEAANLAAMAQIPTPGLPGVPPGVNVADLMAAFAIQNGMPPEVNAQMQALAPEVALAVMKAGPLDGDKTVALSQRLEKVMAEAKEAVAAQSTVAAAQEPAQMQAVAVAAATVPSAEHAAAPAFQMVPVAMMPTVAAPSLPVPATAMPISPCGQAPTVLPSHLGGQHQDMNAVYTQQVMYQQQAGSPPPPPPLVAPAAMPAAPQAAVAAASGDPLSDFCRQNGVDASCEQVLRASSTEMQAKVMAEGPLVGENPSTVLIARVRKLMGQA